MFTDLSARSCIDRRRRRKSPVSVYADNRRGPTHRGPQVRGQEFNPPTQWAYTNVRVTSRKVEARNGRIQADHFAE
jgi:hypothetical protein